MRQYTGSTPGEAVQGSTGLQVTSWSRQYVAPVAGAALGEANVINVMCRQASVETRVHMMQN